MGVRIAAIGLISALAALVITGVAQAGDTTRFDGRDTRGALDIRFVTHHYVGGETVTHAVHTYKPFQSRLLNGDSTVVFAFDINADNKPDRLGVVVWYRGHLRGAVLSAAGKLLAVVPVSRPDAKTIKAAFPVRLLGDKGQYRWLAFTEFQSKKLCRKGCTDLAPNGALITHQLWQPATLSVGITGGGTVRSEPAGVSCAVTCSAKFRPGTVVRLQATPADGFEFTGWGGACSGTEACTVMLRGTTVVTATFAPIPILTLTVTGPGYVDVAPPNQRCSVGTPCVFRYVRGTSVTLTASSGGSYVFNGWEGACSGTNPVCTLTMDGPKTVTARTGPPSFTSAVPTFAP